MSNNPFDIKKFNEVLQKSSNICSGAKKDIESAVNAALGIQVLPCTAFYKCGRELRIVVDGKAYDTKGMCCNTFAQVSINYGEYVPLTLEETIEFLQQELRKGI